MMDQVVWDWMSRRTRYIYISVYSYMRSHISTYNASLLLFDLYGCFIISLHSLGSFRSLWSDQQSFLFHLDGLDLWFKNTRMILATTVRFAYSWSPATSSISGIFIFRLRVRRLVWSAVGSGSALISWSLCMYGHVNNLRKRHTLPVCKLCRESCYFHDHRS